MKKLTQYLNEWLINKKIDKVRTDKTEILFTPITKIELIRTIKELFKKGETNLNCIDVSNIKDMKSLFNNLSNWKCIDNIDVSEWDVSNVENMNMMFSYCHNFNCDLSKWNVSKVKHMDYMFFECKNFNCNLSNWDVSNVEDAYGMFADCENFIGEGLEKWNMNKCKDMKNMLKGCNKLKKIPSWYKE